MARTRSKVTANGDLQRPGDRNHANLYRPYQCHDWEQSGHAPSPDTATTKCENTVSELSRLLLDYEQRLVRIERRHVPPIDTQTHGLVAQARYDAKIARGVSQRERIKDAEFHFTASGRRLLWTSTQEASQNVRKC